MEKKLMVHVYVIYRILLKSFFQCYSPNIWHNFYEYLDTMHLMTHTFLGLYELIFAHAHKSRSVTLIFFR